MDEFSIRGRRLADVVRGLLLILDPKCIVWIVCDTFVISVKQSADLLDIIPTYIMSTAINFCKQYFGFGISQNHTEKQDSMKNEGVDKN